MKEELYVTLEDIKQIAREVEHEQTIDELKFRMFEFLKNNKDFMPIYRRTKKKLKAKFEKEYEAERKFRKKNECKICGCYPCMSSCNW